MKTIIANWLKKGESLGGQEIFFSELSNILNAKLISYHQAGSVLNNLSSDPFRIVHRGDIIDKYLLWYEKLFKPDLIIKNSGIGGFTKLNTPQITIFQDPFYNVLKQMLRMKIFGNCEHYLACMELQKRTAEQGVTVAVSNFMKKDMEDCGIKCDKIIEEGVDIEKFKPVENKEKLKKSRGLPTDKKIGIVVTKFIPTKGWDILAKLINKFPEIHWIVVLTIKEERKPKLKNVTLIEEVVPDFMPEVYNCADFFINTSPVESFGLSAVEAAACNLPIITYKTGFAWDWWDKRLGLRVDKWNYESFEKAVKNLFEDKVEYEPRKAIIERGFTKKRMAKHWKRFVENLIKK